MGIFRKVLQRLFGRSGPSDSESRQFMDPGQAKRQGYVATPGGFLQWSPTAPRRSVNKSGWKPCHACGRLIPVVADRLIRVIDARTAGQRPLDPGGTVVQEGVTHLAYTTESAGTWTYVCPRAIA
jgi:hypothetical protein